MSSKREGYEFTGQQEVAIGELVVDHWGDNIQTGFIVCKIRPYKGFTLPYLAAKKGPNHPVVFYQIDPDGQVTVRDDVGDFEWTNGPSAA
jgi:hypothetical protein